MSEPTQSHREAAAALAALLDEIPDAIPGLPAVIDEGEEIVDAEIVDDEPVPAPPPRRPFAGQPTEPVPEPYEVGLPVPMEPGQKELMLRGRVVLAQTGHNPDDWVDAEAEAELATAIPENTLRLMHWALGAARWYCQERRGFAVREYMPMTVATLRMWIKDHWKMTRPDGQLRGRRGRPYSPNTVQLRVYLMSKIWKLKGYVSPVGHPKVQLQLRAYRKKYEKAGFTPDEAYPLSHDDSVALGRACQRYTLAGLRNQAAFRLQFDTGMRASELLALRVEDVTWSKPEWAAPGYDGPLNATIRVRKSKTDQDSVGREVGVEYVPWLTDPETGEPLLDRDKEPIPHPDVDMDPAALLGRWVQVLREHGHTRGRLWPNVTNAAEPLQFKVVDGEIVDLPERFGGSLIDQAWTYEQYEQALKWFAKQAGVDTDPVTGEKRRITSHANRAGHVTASLDGGEPVEKVALRTGHSPTGSIHGYYRNKRRFGQANTGAQIRRRVVRRRVS